MRRSLFFLFFILFIAPLHAKSYDELSVEVPFDGGGMAFLSRMWIINSYVHLGGSVGGGVIDRDFKVSAAGKSNLRANSHALVLPFIGPRLDIVTPILGISVGYGLFWAKTDFGVEGLGASNIKGETKGWGTGINSPFLSIDFFDKKRKMVYGFGLGGFFGISYPDLKAEGQGYKITSKENPFEGLTFHLKAAWGN